jgi:hypothetical protein
VDVLSELIGERNTAHPGGIKAARSYLRDQLCKIGHEVIEQTYSTTLREAVNLEVILRGSRPKARVLVVGAHYDSAAGTPGADDNASAVAILLEVARSLLPLRLKREVRLVFYDCEEPPHYHLGEMGSHEHARSLRSRGERLLGMICLESLGYFPCSHRSHVAGPWYVRLLQRAAGNRGVVVVSDVRSIGFGFRFVWSFLVRGRFRFLPAAVPRRLLPVIELSDHRSYWDQGYPALMVTDTALLRNPNYHRPTDRLETLNLERMAQLCEAITRTIAHLVR